MFIAALVTAALTVWAVSATVLALRTDGYRRTPTRAGTHLQERR